MSKIDVFLEANNKNKKLFTWQFLTLINTISSIFNPNKKKTQSTSFFHSKKNPQIRIKNNNHLTKHTAKNIHRYWCPRVINTHKNVVVVVVVF